MIMIIIIIIIMIMMRMLLIIIIVVVLWNNNNDDIIYLVRLFVLCYACDSVYTSATPYSYIRVKLAMLISGMCGWIVGVELKLGLEQDHRDGIIEVEEASVNHASEEAYNSHGPRAQIYIYMHIYT